MVKINYIHENLRSMYISVLIIHVQKMNKSYLKNPQNKILLKHYVGSIIIIFGSIIIKFGSIVIIFGSIVIILGSIIIILRSIIINLGSIVIILGSIGKIFETFDPYMMLIQETNLKITGPTDIFGENLDYKTIIREPFANDLAHMFDE